MSDVTNDKTKVVYLLALSAGHSKKAAAGKAGVTYRTVCRWQAEHEGFAEAVEVASGQGRGIYEELLRQAAEKDWRAALAAYEVIYLGGVRAKGSAEQEPAPDAPAVVPFAGVTPEQAAARADEVLAILRKAKGSDEAVRDTLAHNLTQQRSGQ